VVAAAQVRPLVREHGPQLARGEHVYRGRGEINAAPVPGQTVSRGLEMGDDDGAQLRIRPAG
jgi:hypothetical protein